MLFLPAMATRPKTVANTAVPSPALVRPSSGGKLEPRIHRVALFVRRAYDGISGCVDHSVRGKFFRQLLKFFLALLLFLLQFAALRGFLEAIAQGIGRLGLLFGGHGTGHIAVEIVARSAYLDRLEVARRPGMAMQGGSYLSLVEIGNSLHQGLVDADGKWNFAVFNHWNDERKVDVDRRDSDWYDYWWFAGVRK